MAVSRKYLRSGLCTALSRLAICDQWISMRFVSSAFVSTASFFGRVSVRTPFSYFAEMSSGFTSSSTRKDL